MPDDEVVHVGDEEHDEARPGERQPELEQRTGLAGIEAEAQRAAERTPRT